MNFMVEMLICNYEVRDVMENDFLFLCKVLVCWYSELIKFIEIVYKKIDDFLDVLFLLM